VYIYDIFPNHSTTKTSSQVKFWFSLSLTFAVIYGLWDCGRLSVVSMVQDDAQQHVFWMQRFLDQRCSQDLIADYFQSVAPAGYRYLPNDGRWASILCL